MIVRFCKDEFTVDSPELQRLRDSNDVLADDAALRERFDDDGYLFLRGYLDRNEVLAAREAILHYMDQHEGLEPGARPLDGVMGEYGKSVPMIGRPVITHHPAVKQVLEAPRLFELTRRLMGESTISFDYKWLRAVGNDGATGCHMDHVYMGRGSKRVTTCWIPLGDIPVEQGTLVVAPRSHREESFAKIRSTYGRMDVDRDKIAGWFTDRPREITDTFGGTWATDDVQAGDIILIGMHTMHASTTNTTDRWRLSCDVRFQPASEPTDERWVGLTPRGHEPAAAAEVKPIDVARAEWGL